MQRHYAKDFTFIISFNTCNYSKSCGYCWYCYFVAGKTKKLNNLHKVIEAEQGFKPSLFDPRHCVLNFSPTLALTSLISIRSVGRIEKPW